MNHYDSNYAANLECDDEDGWCVKCDDDHGDVQLPAGDWVCWTCLADLHMELLEYVASQLAKPALGPATRAMTEKVKSAMAGDGVLKVVFGLALGRAFLAELEFDA